ncbi:MAG TPA: SdiA-regulated domain-containing protein [Flavobacteriales bacterium]|nr:SdiA-regulated domain-containing protein [Flavobacteriales bacterium]
MVASCAAVQKNRPGGALPYDMKRPSQVFELPALLIEVSALTDVDDTTLACVHDESASVYFLSARSGRIVDSVTFAGPADMEGLTRVGSNYYALRSDGLIYRLSDRASRMQVIDTFRIDVPNRNIEGLGFDDHSGSVLVSPKDFVKGSKEGKDERLVYALDPGSMTSAPQVILKVSLDKLVRQALTKGIEVPRTMKKGRERPALKLRYSSVAVHPVSHYYYLLSAVDHTLLVLDRQGDLVDLVVLDEKLLPKAEGITFMPDGDMWLSSEGKGRSAVLARYALNGR